MTTMGLSYYSISDLTLTEGESGIITVYRTGDTSYGSDIDVATADGTATQYKDYTGWYGKYHFDPGMSNVTIRLNTVDDALVEGTETLSIKLTNNDVSGVVTKGTSTVTINDNDFPPSRYTLSPAYLTEGETKNLTITREGYTGRAETVIIETANGTAISGSDYQTFSQEITFNAGETTKYIGVNSYDDRIAESTESFSVSLKSKATRAELALTTVTIADNDALAPAPIVIAPNPVVIAPAQTVNSNNPVTTSNSNNPVTTTNSNNLTTTTNNNNPVSNTNSNNPITTTNSNNPINATVTTNSSNQLNSNNTYNITNNYTTNVNSGNTYTANSNSGNTLNNTNSGNTTTTTNTNSNNTSTTTNTNWTLMRVDSSVKTGDIVSQFFKDSPVTSIQTRDITETKILDVVTNTWSDKVQVNRVSRATDKGDTLEALAPDSAVTTPTGSVLAGGKGADIIMGKLGWDNLEGGEGDDLIHGGNGRDIISGGSGRDELWGDFGWNTFKSEKDGFSDLIVVKSDQWVFNWLYGKAGNNANGEKCDIIEGLDSSDKLKIVGANTKDLTFSEGVSAHGVKGIGVYAKGALEALYTGGDLTIAQLTQMTSGDASEGAFANTITKFGSW